MVVLGARQVGKSTLAQGVADEESQFSILTLDDQATREAALNDPTGFVAELTIPSSSMKFSARPTCSWRSSSGSTRTSGRGGSS